MEHNRKYETRKALELLLKGKKGDVIDKATMAEHIGRECWDSKGEGYRCVKSAMEAAINQGIYWQRDKAAGAYVCGTVDDVNKCQTGLLRQARKRANKSLRVAMCVETSEMNQDQRVQHSLNTIVAGLVVTATGAPLRKRIEVTKATQPSVDDMLKLITGEQS